MSLLFVCDSIYTSDKDNNGNSGDLMLKRDIVFELMKKNNGILKSRQATEAGIDNKTLQRMNQAGEIERVEKGIYIKPDQIEDCGLTPEKTMSAKNSTSLINFLNKGIIAFKYPH